MDPIVTFEMEDGSVFRAELYPELAPNTVNNFLSLVKRASMTASSFTASSPAL